MILDKTIKNNLLRFSLTLFMIVSGFSQVMISGLKPSDFVILLLFTVLLIKGRVRVPIIGVAFLFSFFYAWLLGGFDDIKTLVTNIIIFIIVFSLIDYLKRVAFKETILYLRYFNNSMFASNLLTLMVFILLPQYIEHIADISSGGARLKGFFTQTNGYAFVLLVGFPIAIYFLNKRKSLFNLINVIVYSIAILLTQSRGVILSLILGFGIVFLLYLIRSRKIKRYFGIILLAIVFVFSLFTFLPSFLEEKFGVRLSRFNAEASLSGERNINEISLESMEDDRLYLIEAGIRTIAEYPFGLGFQPHHLKIGEVTGVYLIPHNYFLSLFLNYGVVFGLFWIVVIYALLKKGLLKIYRLQTTPNDALFYLTIMMVSLSLFYLTHSSDWSYMYILIAFYIALLNRKVNKNETTSHR